jgi:hypothetical protein
MLKSEVDSAARPSRPEQARRILPNGAVLRGVGIGSEAGNRGSAAESNVKMRPLLLAVLAHQVPATTPQA